MILALVALCAFAEAQQSMQQSPLANIPPHVLAEAYKEFQAFKAAAQEQQGGQSMPTADNVKLAAQLKPEEQAAQVADIAHKIEDFDRKHPNANAQAEAAAVRDATAQVTGYQTPESVLGSQGQVSGADSMAQLSQESQGSQGSGYQATDGANSMGQLSLPIATIPDPSAQMGGNGANSMGQLSQPIATIPDPSAQMGGNGGQYKNTASACSAAGGECVDVTEHPCGKHTKGGMCPGKWNIRCCMGGGADQSAGSSSSGQTGFDANAGSMTGGETGSAGSMAGGDAGGNPYGMPSSSGQTGFDANAAGSMTGGETANNFNACL